MKIVNKIFAYFVITALLAFSQYALPQSKALLANAQYTFKVPVRAQITDQTRTQATLAAEMAKPSVVTVIGTAYEQDIGTRADGFWEMFKPRSVKITTGSGFFIDPSGFILTNNHVVSNEQAEYQVELADGTILNAKVLAKDEKKDLALLKIPGKNYPVLPLGDSSELERGQLVISLGNAFGEYPESLSAGTVKKMGQTIEAVGEGPARLYGLIQISNQLYPGYSGGPTFDSSGNVVGVNVATAIDRPNLSFAIPINDAKEFIKQSISVKV